jgi:hypothetical protein
MMKEAAHEMQLHTHFAHVGCLEMVSCQQHCMLSHFQFLFCSGQELVVRRSKKQEKREVSLYKNLIHT